MNKTFYLTTTLPYVNADPHIGFAFELISADIIARYRKLKGDEVFFNTGTDEHGTKVWEKAKEEGKDTQAYTDEYAEKFKKLREPLGLLPDVNFIRTTDPHHKLAAQEFWKRCATSGDIYKKNYRIKYCVGCELEKTESELQDGRCSVHPNLELQIIEEENYFFRLSGYQEKLLALYHANPDFVVPAFRLNEIRSLIKEKGLEDFSISRLKSKMPWGVPVPGDSDHVMYVWFDALVNYISAIGWPERMTRFEKWWPVVQFAGKDQVRQQAVMWQAMLMSAGIAPSKQIVIHGFIQSGGQKMSKSLGNVIDPLALVQEYGTDALRFYLARHIHPFEDSDFTMEKFKEAYNADLANGIGNLTSRIMKMAAEHLALVPPILSFLKGVPHSDEGRDFLKEVSESSKTEDLNPSCDLPAEASAQAGDAQSTTVSVPPLGKGESETSDFPFRFQEALNSYNIQRAAEIISETVTSLDRRIQETEPFKLVKQDKEKGVSIIKELVVGLYAVSRMLAPFMPETAKKMKELIQTNKMPGRSLFPRK